MSEQKEYWLMWRGLGQSARRRYSRDDGFITHACPGESERALCGTVCNDSGWLRVGEDGAEPGCIRCRDALRKLGVMAPK